MMRKMIVDDIDTDDDYNVADYVVGDDDDNDRRKRGNVTRRRDGYVCMCICLYLSICVYKCLKMSQDSEEACDRILGGLFANDTHVLLTSHNADGGKRRGCPAMSEAGNWKGETTWPTTSCTTLL